MVPVLKESLQFRSADRSGDQKPKQTAIQIRWAFPVTNQVIELVDMHKSFDESHVLRGITLSVRTGESLAIIGGSGAGKSVLLKCILGLLKPDGGEIRVRGTEVSNPGRGPDTLRIGMLFQGGALFDSLNVWQNVAFRLLRGPGRASKDEAKEIALQKLSRVGLDPSVAELFPADLSGGMKKRAGLARALVGDPEVIFFDEPTTGLDPVRATVINNLVRGIVDESGVTAVTITHDMASVRIIADRVALLNEGIIQWTGPVSELDSSDNYNLRRFVSGRNDGPSIQTA